MKFFVPVEWDDRDSREDGKYKIPESIHAQFTQYAEHLERMRGILPEPVLKLAQLRGVHDGAIVLVRHDRAKRILALTLRCGYDSIGYFDLALRYIDVDISAEHELTLACLARATRDNRRFRPDLDQHELDVTEDGRLEHRILFHDDIWFLVRCSELQWVTIPRSDWRLPSQRDRFPGGPVTPFATMVAMFPHFVRTYRKESDDNE